MTPGIFRTIRFHLAASLLFGAVPLAASAQAVGCSPADLVSAIQSAVTSGGAQTLTLSAGCVYTLTQENNADQTGATGLPAISGASITILGNGATIERASTAPAFRLFYVKGTGTLSISDVTLRGGLTTSSTVRTQGDGEYGGAILNVGVTTVTDSTITDNRCGNGFPGSADETPTDGGGGAGLSNSGSLTVIRSTITNNTTGSGGGTNRGAPGLGGGISNNGTLRVFNSTICNNATGTGFPSPSGAGIYSSFGSVTVKNSTICGNQDTAATGGGITVESGTSSFVNTIVADNAPFNCSREITDGGNNLETATSCGFNVALGSKVGTPAGLSPVASNGGKTATAALSATSAAVNGGNSTVCSDTDVGGVDQRGEPRPAGACDIGAYELVSAVNCTAKPSKPVLFAPAQPAALTDNKVPLSWSAVSCADNYKVTVKTTGADAKVVTSKKVTGVTQFTTKALKPGAYVWSIDACNKKGCNGSKKGKFRIVKPPKSGTSRR